jgi:hypothetical protein
LWKHWQHYTPRSFDLQDVGNIVNLRDLAPVLLLTPDGVTMRMLALMRQQFTKMD